MNKRPTLFGLFEGPGKPTGLAGMVMIIIFTHAAALLMNQPAAFWLNPQSTTIHLPFEFLLHQGPVLYLAVVIAYMVLAGLLLRRLNISAAIVLAGALVLMHSLALFRTTACGFYPLFESHSGTACFAYRYVPLLLISIVFALILLVERLPERLVYWGGKILVPFAVLWIGLMGYGMVRAAFPPNSPWKPLAPAHSPGPRTVAAIAYDSKRQRAVLFGGITGRDNDGWVYDNSTWEWDGKDWHQIQTAVAPAGRERHGMAYDEQLGKVILYGGKNASGNLADLWEWDGISWHRLCPVCNPAARFSHQMIFDTKRQSIVIYGGQDGEVGFAEAWTWSGGSWNGFRFGSAAPAIYTAPLIYDSGREQVVSFIGAEWGGTWIWKDDLWSKLDPIGQPPLREDPVFVYDPVRDHSILFGGRKNDEALFDDTWVFNGETWIQLGMPGSPPQRSKAIAFYDPTRQSVILFGGEGRGTIYSDMWELTLPEGNQP